MNRQNMIKLLQSLSEYEASKVLDTLLDDHPDILKKAYDAAMKVANDVDVDKITNDVYRSLSSIDIDDLYGRSGKTRYGYVEITDEAYVMFEESIDPFIDEMKKNQHRALPAISKAYCIGIINALRKFGKESYSDFSEYVRDESYDYIDTVLGEWKKGKPSKEDIAEVELSLKS